MSETISDSKIPLNDKKLYIKACSMIRADHPSDTKRGVSIYYKEYWPLTKKIDICKLNECTVTEIIANNKIVLEMSLQMTKTKSRAVWVLLRKPRRCAFKY